MAVLVEGVEESVMECGVLAGQRRRQPLQLGHEQREHTGRRGPHLIGGGGEGGGGGRGGGREGGGEWGERVGEGGLGEGWERGRRNRQMLKNIEPPS